MIDLDNQVVIVHPPKTGGQAVQMALLGHVRQVSGSKIERHATLSEIITAMPEAREWRKTILVRNPYDRLVSFYHYVKLPRNATYNCNWTLDLKASGSFESWLAGVDLPWIFEQPRTKGNGQPQHALRPMSHYDSSAECEPIHCEHLLIELADFLGCAVVLQRVNAHPHPKARWDPVLRQKVNEAFGMDFQRFGYER